MPLNANSPLLQKAKTFGGFTAVGIEYDPSTSLAPPLVPGLATAGSGGTVLAGVYTALVTYVTATGETLGSATATITTTGTTSTITITSPIAATGATGWYAYVSQVNGTSLTRQQTAGSPTAIASNLVITAPPTSSGLAPPVTNTSGVGAPGTAVAPDDYIPGTSNTLTASMAFVDEMMEVNSPFAHTVHEPTIETNSGSSTYTLGPTLGLDYLFAGLGGKAAQGSVTATSTGSATSGLAYTTIPITGSFVKGRPVVCGVGANSEPSIIHSYTAGTLMVYRLKINATASSGLSVTMPAETKFANSLMSASAIGQLPLLTVEKNMGGDQSQQFPSTLVESLTFTMSPTTCQVVAALYGTQPYKPLNASSSPVMSTWNPSTSDYNAAMRPFTALNQMIAVYTDIDGSGAQVQAAVGIKNAKITYNNNLVKEQVLGNQTMQAWASANVTCQVDYTEIDTARYNALYELAVRTGLGTELHLGYAKNTGTLTSPVWRFVVFEIPFANYTASTGNEPLNATADKSNIALGRVLRGSQQDLICVHVV